MSILRDGLFGLNKLSKRAVCALQSLRLRCQRSRQALVLEVEWFFRLILAFR